MGIACNSQIHCLNPQLVHKRIRSKPLSTSSSFQPNANETINQTSKPDVQYNVIKLKTLGGCKLGVSRYPDFDYNAEGGAGSGKAATTISDGQVYVDFDVQKVNIPPLSTATTKLLGLPLPPFLKIDIVTETLQGEIDTESGKVELTLRAEFWFSIGSLYRAPPLLVKTVLTSEETKGKMRGGKGERLDKEGRCKLVGVAVVQPVDDLFMDAFLGLPTECLAVLNAIISLEST